LLLYITVIVPVQHCYCASTAQLAHSRGEAGDCR